MTAPNKPIGPRNMFAARRRVLARRMKKARLDAVVVTRPADMFYLTGYEGDDGAVVIGAGWTCLAATPLYGEHAHRDCRDVEVRVGRLWLGIAAALKGRGVRRLGAQDEHLTVRAWRRLGAVIGSRKLMPADGLVGQCRLVKDDREVRMISRAVRAAEEAFKVLFRRGKRAFVGRTERQVAAELDYQMALAGAAGPAFPTVVAGGKGASQPHYRPTSRRIRSGEPVLIDWGARAAGYRSDLTRVIFTDTIPAEIGRIYEVVAAALAAGLKAVRPGIKAKSVDRAARGVIAEAGYGNEFIHGVGHGLGLEIHEGPVVAGRGEQRLTRNMVITVEPGIYLPGVGGVRIEDDVVVTAQGRRRLSSLPVDIRKMVLR